MDPVPEAFEILTNRVSHLEELLTDLHDRKRRKEFTASGLLDNIFLRQPFAVWRFPPSYEELDSETDDPPRKERLLPEIFNCAIVSFNEDAVWPHVKGCVDPTLFTADELKRIAAAQNGKGYCVRCLSVDIPSNLEFVCNENTQRQLRRWTRGSEICDDVVIILDGLGFPAFRIQTKCGVNVGHLARLVLTLLTQVNGVPSAIKRMDIYPCNNELFGAFLRYQKSPSTLSPEEKRFLTEHSFYHHAICM